MRSTARRQRAGMSAVLLGTALLYATAFACSSKEDSAASPSPDASSSDTATVDSGSDAQIEVDPTPSDGAIFDSDDEGDAGGVVKPKDGGVGFEGAYASPTIVRDGSTYHAYFAKQTIGGKHYNVPHATFTEDGTWTFVGEALPHLNTQAVETGGYPVWAPAAAKIDATHWVLHYTAQLVGTEGKKCLYRAHAATADGPFVDDFAAPLFCADATLWAIDPYLVSDASGAWHLAARIDEAGGINTIQLRELGPMGLQFATGSAWSKLTNNSPTSWEQPVMENAAVVRLSPPTASPHWFVFYSAGAWDKNSYSIGFADCGTSIGGPCTKKTTGGPWLATNAAANVFAPGTPTFYKNAAGDMLMSVQAWQFTGGKSNPKNNGQIMRTYKVSINDAYEPEALLVRIDL